MKIKIYNAWFGYDDMNGKTSFADTIVTSPFFNMKDIDKWIDAKRKDVLDTYGYKSVEQYEEDPCPDVEIHWNFTEQELELKLK